MDVFTLAAKLTLDSGDFERDLGKQESVFSSFGGKLASAAGGIATAVGAGLTAAATGVGMLVKQAVDGYAQYEQLVGGVETLFGAGGKDLEAYAKAAGKSVDQVKGKWLDLKRSENNVLTASKNAYKTAGMNMNQYMETVTAFSASLISSLSGDTIKASEIADMAITDMADNANKMGTSMEAIQNAYQGFAKQNYTMLDNLKLGYGGTKTEMERLLADAEKISGIKYDISNLNDVFEAIHVIQTELGITGTTAEEAAKTISGSLGMTKAAWENLIIAFGDGNADLDYYIGNLVDSAEIAFNNLMPVIETALSGIATFVEKIAPVIAEKLPDMVSDVLPKLLTAAASILEGVIDALPALVGSLFEAIGSIDWLSLGTSIWEAIKAAFLGVAEWLSGIFEGGKKAIGEIEWASVGTDLLGKIGNGLADIADWFKKKFEAASTGIAQINWKQVGENVKTAIGNGLTAIKEWFQTTFLPGPDGIALVDWAGAGKAILGAIGEGFAAVIEFFQGLFTGVPEALTTSEGLNWAGAGQAILDAIGSAFATIGEWIIGLFGPAVTALTGEELTWSTAGTNILGLITDGIGDLVTWATGLFQQAADAILTVDWVGVGSKLRLWIETAVVGIINWFNTTFGLAKDEALKIDWANLGESIVNLIQEGLKAIDGIFSGLFGEGWEDFKTTIKELTPILVGVAAAATVVGVAFLAVKAAMAFTDIITNLQTGFTNLFNVITNHPFVTIIAMIVGLVAALVTAYQTNEEFRDKVDAAWATIKETAQTVWATVSGAVELAFEVIQKAWDDVSSFFTETIPDAWEQLKTDAETFFTPIKEAIDGAIRVVQTAWDAVVTFFTETIPGIWKTFTGDGVAQFDAVKSAIDGAIKIVSTAWSGVETFFTTTIPSAWATLQTKADEVFTAIGTAISGALDWVNSIIDGIANLLGLNADKTITVTTVYETVGTPNNAAEDALRGGGKSSLPPAGAPVATTPGNFLKGGGVLGTELVAIDQFGNLVKHARSMSGGAILRGATLFGWDAQGNPQIGGGEGPEAVVGVGSLNQQIREAVRDGLSGIVAGIAGALNGNNQQPIYVVLDTGELVGAIGPRMDEELGGYGDWKGGGRA